MSADGYLRRDFDVGIIPKYYGGKRQDHLEVHPGLRTMVITVNNQRCGGYSVSSGCTTVRLNHPIAPERRSGGRYTQNLACAVTWVYHRVGLIFNSFV